MYIISNSPHFILFCPRALHIQLKSFAHFALLPHGAPPLSQGSRSLSVSFPRVILNTYYLHMYA